MKILLISALALILPPSFTGPDWNEGPPTPVTAVTTTTTSTITSSSVVVKQAPIIDLTPTTTRLCENP